jgi:GNAT superfamily N-acetyltransferase
MTLVRARPADVEILLALRAEAVAWLRELGSDQWSTPFPREDLLARIAAGDTWLVWEGARPAATITVTTWGPPELWAPDELAEPALYVHKLTVSRSNAGRRLGAELLDWAGGRANREGRRWLRLDCWSDNRRLHRYYMQEGFNHLRTVPREPPSGALFQRPSRSYKGMLRCDLSPSRRARITSELSDGLGERPHVC